MSDRTPATDALETLGMIHYKPEYRDAIHLAVEPVTAGEDLKVGAKIGILNGVAFRTGTKVMIDLKEITVPYHGIVDPFLPEKKLGDTDFTYGVLEGERFWFVMAPRQVRSLRHVWEHPDFPEGV